MPSNLIAAVARRRSIGLQCALFGVALCLASAESSLAQDEADWPMYNRDVRGTRHNPVEESLSVANVGLLEEKWRYPAADSSTAIGVIHATPTVVGGFVYFGTATDPTFYKLAPDGALCWSYKNPAHKPAFSFLDPFQGKDAARKRRFESTGEGILGSALVTSDRVYFGDLAGWFYALDRETGEVKWTINSRAKPFPGAHGLNSFFASPILANGKLIVAGGTLEQVVAAIPLYAGCKGRGWVMALDPASGNILWKFDVGPEPQPLDPPITITDSWGKHIFHFGPATSSVWSTPSFDEESGTIYFGTDVNPAPRRPTADNPRLDTPESCAVFAISVEDGVRRWSTQISPGDVWTNAMRSYNPEEGRYKDQSIGDTPKIYSIAVDGQETRVVGVGSKNGGFYVLRAQDGRIVAHTPIYTGPPRYPLTPEPDKRMLALPSAIGGLQTGCATDGRTIYTNGVDALLMGSQERMIDSAKPPTAGRVVALSLDTNRELWRHERPRVASLGGPAPKPVYENVGDPVASGIAVANGVLCFTTVASGKLVAISAANGELLKEFDLGPVWAGPSVSRGRIYVGSGNTLFSTEDYEAYLPKQSTGVLRSFGLPGEDEVSRLSTGVPSTLRKPE